MKVQTCLRFCLTAAAALLLALDAPAARADVFTNVPEAAGYELVYDLELPNVADFDASGPFYTLNRSGELQTRFDRVAYYLELDGQWIYVSMDAFTCAPTMIGVPTFASGAIFERNVANMNVFSNVVGITTGTAIATGNIEFWPHNYSRPANSGIGGDGGVYDFDDTRSPTGIYGSMQVHNHGAGQTLFAYNHWNANATGCLGIGNQPSGDPDWTFADNANQHTVKRLQVLARATLPITAANGNVGRRMITNCSTRWIFRRQRRHGMARRFLIASIGQR